MRSLREIVTWAGAAALVGAVAFLPGWESAEAARVPVDERPIAQRRARFLELFVNSMDVFGPAQVVSCFDYSCDGPIADVLGVSTPDGYQLVRTVHRGSMFRSPCDEIFRLGKLSFAMRKAQTRWMRLNGPSGGGTPVGCFEGKLVILADVNDVDVEIFAAKLKGTTGFRPALADPTINTQDPAGDGRCSTPLRDEGCYVGRFSLRGLNKIREGLDVELSPKQLRSFLRLYSRCVVEGTFEGQIEISEMRNFCSIVDGQWWYDGVMKCRCRPTDVVKPGLPSNG